MILHHLLLTRHWNWSTWCCRQVPRADCSPPQAAALCDARCRGSTSAERAPSSPAPASPRTYPHAAPGAPASPSPRIDASLRNWTHFSRSPNTETTTPPTALTPTTKRCSISSAPMMDTSRDPGGHGGDPSVRIFFPNLSMICLHLT